MLLNASFILIPIILVIYVFLSVGVHLPPSEASKGMPLEVLNVWRTLRFYSILYYAISIFLVRRYEIKNNVKLALSGKMWFSGVLLTFFSNAIAGFLIDSVYLSWFIRDGFNNSR